MAAQIVAQADNQRTTNQRSIILTITTATGGAVSYTILAPNGSDSERFNGYLHSVEVVPGSTTPTTGFSLQIQNSRGTDLMRPGATSLTTDTTKKQIFEPRDGNSIPLLRLLSKDTLTLVIATAGDEKTMTVIINIAQPDIQ